MRNKSVAVISIFTLFLGIACGMQISSIQKGKSTTVEANVIRQQYEDQVREEQKRSDTLKEQISNRLKENAAIVSRHAQAEDEIKALNEKLKIANLRAGLTPVKGPGITISLTDAKDDAFNGDNIDTVLERIVHDSDVKEILNELNKAGAEAVSINDERVVIATNIQCTGPTISINGRRHVIPFIFNAIGKPNRLYNKVKNSSIYRCLVDEGIQVDMKKADEVKIPQYILSKGNGQ